MHATKRSKRNTDECISIIPSRFAPIANFALLSQSSRSTLLQNVKSPVD